MALETLEAECRGGGACGIAAAKVLLEFGYGKATRGDDEAEASGQAVTMDFSGLTDEEVLTMTLIMRKVASTQHIAD